MSAACVLVVSLAVFATKDFLGLLPYRSSASQRTAFRSFLARNWAYAPCRSATSCWTFKASAFFRASTVRKYDFTANVLKNPSTNMRIIVFIVVAYTASGEYRNDICAPFVLTHSSRPTTRCNPAPSILLF